jgi:hypothetical protein
MKAKTSLVEKIVSVLAVAVILAGFVAGALAYAMIASPSRETVRPVGAHRSAVIHLYRRKKSIVALRPQQTPLRLRSASSLVDETSSMGLERARDDETRCPRRAADAVTSVPSPQPIQHFQRTRYDL